LMNADGSRVRQLTYDQDHSWCPRVLNDGRVIYSRWEYNDLPHYFSRLLFSMNPDGTKQAAFYGTNSWFPNTMMYARPVPGSNSKIVCTLSGHHGNPRMGEVALIDSAEGERENTGVTRLLPGRHRKVENPVVDQYATGEWPQFVQPYPLSDKYFLVSCKPSPDEPWGLYLLDVFDNLVPLRVEPNASLFEPIPLRATPAPPVIPSAVDLARRDATVYLYDVYRGGGLAGVPRGTVKSLRIVEPVYRYWGNGETHSTAIDGGWDVKRIWGTVPVQPDGSAYFRVPANTPLLVQPLDARGRAQQQMRSWFTAMPGETVSCVGCHEQRREAASAGRRQRAVLSKPAEITPWHGPARGFSFEREVQPVLDRNCVACHSSGRVDLRPLPTATGRFSVAYQTLHPYVRRPGLEADIHMLPPREFIADTSQLVQMLKKGHGGVKLTDEDWDRLITWIDLNVPYAGDWREAYPPAPENLIRRREELRAQDAAAQAQQAAKR
ncbi:MAG: formylglycine-generating enzyme family protein, partial [Armatimonadota bacterium]